MIKWGKYVFACAYCNRTVDRCQQINKIFFVVLTAVNTDDRMSLLTAINRGKPGYT